MPPHLLSLHPKQEACPTNAQCGILEGIAGAPPAPARLSRQVPAPMRALRLSRPGSPLLRRPHLTLVVAAAWAVSLGGCSRGDDAAQAATPATARAAAAPAAGAATPVADTLVKRADLARIRGDSASQLWMIMISDFECPYCKMWHDSVDGPIKQEYVATGKIRQAYINFPLEQHPHAVPAAEAAMCAGAQGKFWELHDAIFNSQDQWVKLGDAAPFYSKLAKDIGLDAAALDACVASHRMRPMIEGDRERGRQAGVRSTPSFIIGGRVNMVGVQPASAIRHVIDSLLAAGAKPAGR
jgi:protein-disulfide isomerase